MRSECCLKAVLCPAHFNCFARVGVLNTVKLLSHYLCVLVHLQVQLQRQLLEQYEKREQTRKASLCVHTPQLRLVQQWTLTHSMSACLPIAHMHKNTLPSADASHLIAAHRSVRAHVAVVV